MCVTTEVGGVIQTITVVIVLGYEPNSLSLFYNKLPHQYSLPLALFIDNWLHCLFALSGSSDTTWTIYKPLPPNLAFLVKDNLGCWCNLISK